MWELTYFVLFDGGEKAGGGKSSSSCGGYLSDCSMLYQPD